MRFSDYSSSGVGVLSKAHSEALWSVRAALPRELDKHEEGALSRRLTRNLLDAHDSGERDPDALRRAALHGLLLPQAQN